METELPRWRQLLALAVAASALASCSGLPDTTGRKASFAEPGAKDTKVARMARSFTTAHPGSSGVHALPKAPDALAARLALAGTADRSIDIQYYIWHSDQSGVLLVGELLRAADRGVQVRMLLDDIGASASDDGLLLLDSHPNIEVRLFNPVALRSARMLGVLLNYSRANRRMHNKAFIADNQVSIVGGRNIGDEYFGANSEMNFADLDVLTVGPVVREVSEQFDAYWNSQVSIEISALAHQHETPKQVAARRQAFLTKHNDAGQSPALQAMRQSPVFSQIRDGRLTFLSGRTWAVYDDPAKITTAADDRSTHLAPQLHSVLDGTQRELFIVSPYFIPGKQGVSLLSGLRQRGVRVAVLTNSLASTDVGAVHSGYSRYRKALLRTGVELYELKPNPGEAGGGSSPFRGSSKAGLHAKTFAFDNRTIFVGSMNLDPRSLNLNTEVGILIDCPPLASQLTRKVLQDFESHAYRVQLDGRKLVWLTTEDGKSVRFTKEPETSAWKRLKTRLVGCLPIEGQL
jgi:putative cardiolipin synthase